MEEPFQYMKAFVVNFKLNNCCYVAPVRIGLLITAYFNIIYDLVSIIGISDDSYSPTIKLLELKILEEEEITTPIPIMCYAAEFAFNVVLLCAIHRKDMVLMRTYMHCCIAAVTASILFYSVVIATIGVLVKIAIVLSISYQLYVLLLVRSAIVEFKIEKRNGELPILVMSSLVHDAKEPAKVVSDVEASVASRAGTDAPPITVYHPIADEKNKERKLESKVNAELDTKKKLDLNAEEQNKKKPELIAEEQNKKKPELKTNVQEQKKKPELKTSVKEHKTFSFLSKKKPESTVNAAQNKDKSEEVEIVKETPKTNVNDKYI